MFVPPSPSIGVVNISTGRTVTVRIVTRAGRVGRLIPYARTYVRRQRCARLAGRAQRAATTGGDRLRPDARVDPGGSGHRQDGDAVCAGGVADRAGAPTGADPALDLHAPRGT